jgi:hypothetical protein
MKAALISYARALLATVLTAIFTVGKLPTDFTAQDWYGVANAAWIAVIPVVIRALDPNDLAFGRKK